jgi:hypothetical protein
MPDPALVDLRILQGTHWSKPFRLLLDDGSLLDTAGYDGRMQVRATVEAATVELECTVGNGRLEVGYSPAPWEASTAYGLGQRVVPPALNGYVHECTDDGTSDSGAPTWPTTIGGTVTDGTVTWTCVATDAIVSNLRIALTPGDTTPLSNWGAGYYDLELDDAFGHTARVLEGSAVLSREVTR